MERKAIALEPRAGRKYDMGRIQTFFLADGAETAEKYSISEWWLEPDTKGPGPHSHEEDDVFYVLEGTVSIMIGDRWVEARRGSFVLAPGGVVHDFENRTDSRAGFLNLSVPGNFEQHVPGIAEWFRERDGR